MALSRKFLQAMGLTEEQVGSIIEAHQETVTGLKGEIDKYKEAETKLANVQKELDQLKQDAENREGKNPWKVKYDALKEEFDGYKAEEQAKATKSAKVTAYKKLLKEIGISEKRIDAVTKVAELDKIELDKDGSIKDVDELKASLKKEWEDFIQTPGEKGATTPNPPSNTGGKRSKEEIMAIKDTAERQKAMMENKELFL